MKIRAAKKDCLSCDASIPEFASVCPYCNAWQDEEERKRRDRQSRVIISCVLSILIPALGFFRIKRYLLGFVWLTITLMLYWQGFVLGRPIFAQVAFTVHMASILGTVYCALEPSQISKQ